MQWYPLSTPKIGSAKAAVKFVGFYLQCRRIEGYFWEPKSGCRSGILLFRTAGGRLQAIPINAVIAWRFVVMTVVSRRVPVCDVNLVFVGNEIDFLRDFARKYIMKALERHDNVVRLVPHLSCYRDHKKDLEPGNRIM